jgi:protein TonB
MASRTSTANAVSGRAVSVSLGAHALLAGLATLVLAGPMEGQPRVKAVEVQLVEQSKERLPVDQPARVPAPDPLSLPLPLPASHARLHVRRPQAHAAAAPPCAMHAASLAPESPTNIHDVAMPSAVAPLAREEVSRPSPTATSGPAAATAPSPVRVVAVPRYRNNPAPEYPVAAKRRREEGEVRLSVTVSPDGRPLRVSLFRSSGHALLDQAAMDAVQRWTFEPARVAGEPVEDRVVVPVRFSLSRQ